MDLIARVPGIKFINEPFIQSVLESSNIVTGLEGALLPEERKLVHVSKEQEGFVRAHLIKNRATKIRGPYAPFNPGHQFFTNRRVLKIVHATALVEWFIKQELPFKYVSLIRHPLTSALSLSKGCPLHVKANLLHPEYVGRYLKPKQLKYCWSVLESGSNFQKCILEWCLDNLPILAAAEMGFSDNLLVTYEELVINPNPMLELICKHCGIERTTEVFDGVNRASASTALDRIAFIENVTPAEMLSISFAEIDSNEAETAFEILKVLQINCYEPGFIMASKRYLSFPGTNRLRYSCDTTVTRFKSPIPNIFTT